MANYYIGQCQFCKQGLLEIVKEENSGIYFIYCDECEAEWATPDHALNRHNGSRFKYGAVTEVTFEEVSALGWNPFITRVNK